MSEARGRAADDRPPGATARVVARVMVRQLLRKQRDSPLLLAVVVGFNLFLAWVLLGITNLGALELGSLLAAGDPISVEIRVRQATLSGVVLVSVMHLLGAASDGRAKHRRVAFLTATSTDAVVAGVLVRRCVASLVLFGPALLAAAVAFAVTARSPASALSLGLGALWLVVVTAVVTLPVGMVGNWLVVGYDLSSNGRLGVGAAVLGVFYLLLFGRDAVVMVLIGTPVGWTGDLLLATVPGTGADPTRALVCLAASVLLVVTAVAVCLRLARAAWYSDPVFGDQGASPRPDETAEPTALGHRLHAVCSQQTAALVAVTWRRTKRTPKVLFYVYPAAFVGVVMAESLVLRGPFSPALYPVIVAFTGAAAAGSGFTLNPLGTEGDALPGLLSSGAGSGRIVRAKALAALLPAVPLVGGATLGVAVGLSALPAVAVVAVLVYAGALLVAATLFSQALGVHYPPDQEDLLGGSVKIPNKSASVAYSVGMFVVAMPGFAGVGQFALTGVMTVPLLVGGVGLSVLAALAAAAGSYRHAVARLGAYSVE